MKAVWVTWKASLKHGAQFKLGTIVGKTTAGTVGGIALYFARELFYHLDLELP